MLSIIRIVSRSRVLRVTGGTALCIPLAILVVLLTAPIVPFDPDEFLAYHAVGCALHPLSYLNPFQESCNLYVLNPLWWLGFDDFYLPLRSYGYVGSAPGWYYLLVAQFWTDPLSIRVFTMLCLVAQAACLGYLFRISIPIVFLALLLFVPYSYQHLVDVGQLALICTSFFLILVVLQVWQRHVHRCTSWIVGLPLLLALLTVQIAWVKLSGLFILPATICIICGKLACTWHEGQIPWMRQRIIVHFLIWATASFCLFILLFLAKDGNGNLYAKAVGGSDFANVILSPLWWYDRVFRFALPHLLHPASTFHIGWSLNLGQNPYLIWLIALASLFTVLGVILKVRSEEPIAHILGYGSLGIATLALIALHPRTWGMHHILLCLPLFILAVLHMLQPLRPVLVGLALSMLLLICYGAISGVMHGIPYSRMIDTALARTILATTDRYCSNRVVVHVSWGMFYADHLLGCKNQILIYANPMYFQSDALTVRHITRQTGRKLMVLTNGHGSDSLEKLRIEFPELQMLSDSNIGKEWQIWSEP